MTGADEREGVEGEYDPEEEVRDGNWKIVELQRQQLSTGEEEEEEIAKIYVKLYRAKDEQWKERAVGDARFLRNKSTGRVSVVMRSQAKKVMCHFLVQGEGLCSLDKMKTTDNAWYWTCMDCSEGKAQLETFAMRFKTPADFTHFQQCFEDAKTQNAAAKDKEAPAEPTKAASEGKEEGKAAQSSPTEEAPSTQAKPEPQETTPAVEAPVVEKKEEKKSE